MNPQFRHQLDAALTPAIDPDRAPAMRAYMRDQFDYLGIGTPQRRLAAKPLLKALAGSGADNLLAHAWALWDLPQREYQYVALDLLALHWKEFNAGHIPQLLEFARSKSWWDTVDALASIIGDVLRHNHDQMDAALQHENMWMRRVAVLHQLGWRDKVDTGRLFKYSLTLAHEKEFFIQKAIGWALRDYARHDPQAIRNFTSEQKDHLSALSYREANKHLI
ncbi:DNA alkylation repair protein [Duganella sp. CT11-25]|uniref:DNA alkylation repair protein n=1 Tax=unclassified Duganella TaxID=2636909 RepID=UPI0039AFAF05